MHNFCKKAVLSKKVFATKAELSPWKLSFIWSGGQGTTSSLALKELCTGNEGGFNSFQKMKTMKKRVMLFSHLFSVTQRNIWQLTATYTLIRWNTVVNTHEKPE